MVSAASVQDRDGGRGILKRLHRALASVRHIFADGGYQGQLIATAKSAWNIVVEVVKKPVDQLGFAVLPRRWVVERTFSWLLRWRRLVGDYERLPETHEAMIKWAMVGLMLNRLAPPPWPETLVIQEQASMTLPKHLLRHNGSLAVRMRDAAAVRERQGISQRAAARLASR